MSVFYVYVFIVSVIKIHTTLLAFPFSPLLPQNGILENHQGVTESAISDALLKGPAESSFVVFRARAT